MMFIDKNLISPLEAKMMSVITNLPHCMTYFRSNLATVADGPYFQGPASGCVTLVNFICCHLTCFYISFTKRVFEVYSFIIKFS